MMPLKGDPLAGSSGLTFSLKQAVDAVLKKERVITAWHSSDGDSLGDCPVKFPSRS